MEENALLVKTSSAEKVAVNFEDTDDIKRVLNGRRLYTIHTRETQKISAELGFHIMGYVDDRGHGCNNAIACRLTGYDYLGSSLLLFKCDDKFNALPLDGDELEALYQYVVQELD